MDSERYEDIVTHQVSTSHAGTFHHYVPLSQYHRQSYCPIVVMGECSIVLSPK